MSSPSPDPIVTAVDEALAQGFVMFGYIRRDLGKDDRDGPDDCAAPNHRAGLRRVKKLAAVRELSLSPEQARILIADIVEARHILARHADERTAAKRKIDDRAAMHQALAAFGKLARRYDPDEIVQDARRCLNQFGYEVGRDGERALEKLPEQIDAYSARGRAAAHISNSVRRMTGRPHDRIVLAIARATVGAISDDGLIRATGRRKKRKMQPPNVSQS